MSNSRPPVRNLKMWVGGTIAILLACAIAVVWGVSASKGISYSQAGFVVHSGTDTTVTWDVYTPKKKAAVCTIVAEDINSNVVGTKQVNLKPSKFSSTRYSVDLRTTSKPVTGTVKECHYAGDQPPSQ